MPTTAAAGADQWASLCDALASRLAQTGMAHAASLCYICAGNVDQVRRAAAAVVVVVVSGVGHVLSPGVQRDVVNAFVAELFQTHSTL